ncbi:exported hypothetical protein [uncultured Paludibacter sp.]|nr:exported hypothetical protein [uncultured Paludibacter sp.]
MKKIILLFFLFCALVLQSQNSVPNGGFENWTTTTYSYPTNYSVNVNKDGIEKGGIFPLTKAAGFQSSYGVQLQTTSELGMAFFLNYDPQGQDPSTWHGGIQYNQKPTGIQGYYKYNVASGDQGLAIIVFSKNGENVGAYTYNLGGLHSDYTAFNFTFSPALTVTPDSVIIAFASSGFSGAQVGSTLILDKISFTGVTSQPTLLNGDFEQWTDVTVDNLTDWYNNNYGSGDEMKKTTDAHTGTYAVELKTYLGEENNQPKAQSAQLMNGYYGDNCDGNCYPLGGYPFTNQSDVLEFYYKYIPVGNDVASVDLYFKKKNSGYDGWYAHTELNASPNGYTYAEIPFDLWFVPDSVIIQFSSSSWNTVSMSTIGSTLKIDDVVFRSQKNNVYKTLNLTAGTLSTSLTSDELNTVTNLTITGNIDARDFKTMRDYMPALTSIDISGTNIVAYTGTEGTYNTTNYTYPANTVPRNGLVNKAILRNINLPNSLTAIGRSGLNGCTGISSVNIPSSVNIIDTLAFRNCSSLTQIEIPSSVTDIKYAAFYQSGLNQIMLNEGLKTIGGFVFELCSSLSNVDIPASVTDIGVVAFLGTNAYVNVNTANANYSSENGILYDKNKTILMYCPSFTSGSFNIPSTVNTVDVDAFYNCQGISNMTLPSSLTTIREWAFENCTGLSTITIPASVSEIQGYAFYNCSGLTSIYARPANPVDLSTSDSVFKYINVVDCKLYVPQGSKSLYQNAIQWEDFQNIIEEGMNIITLKSDASVLGAGTGAGCTSQEMISALNSVADIESLNFQLVDVNDAGTWTNIPPGSPEGTAVINIKPSDGQNGYFKLSFLLPQNFTHVKLNGVANIDDRGRAFLNGNPITPEIENDLAITQFGNVAFETQNPLYFKEGENVIVFSDANTGCGPSGAAFYVTVNYDITDALDQTDYKNINISPNPTDKGFYLPKELIVNEIIITDMRGAKVLNIVSENNYVDVSALQKGVYIIQLQTQDGIYRGKLMKK